MDKRSWERKIGPLIILATLFLVMSPELGALLIVVNSLGLDLIVLLCAIQLRVTSLSLLQSLAVDRARVCVTSFAIFRCVLRTTGVLLAPGRATFGVCAYLFVLSQTLWCPLSTHPGAAT
jgi:hypothetical protein